MLKINFLLSNPHYNFKPPKKAQLPNDFLLSYFTVNFFESVLPRLTGIIMSSS
jgi:hypothetical protein